MASSIEFPKERSAAITSANTELSPALVLSRLTKDAIRELDAGNTPLVVLDLDATLFDNRPRIIKILKDTIREDGMDLPDDVIAAVNSIDYQRMVYRVKDTLKNHGVSDKKILNYFFDGWFKRFFTDRYVVEDIPTAGAVEFSHMLRDKGITLVYLTGRDTPNMRTGTIQGLKNHGFPVPNEENVFLITKPSFEDSDLEFKKKAQEKINAMGSVIGVFDNEPGPLNALARYFSDALIVFLDTMHSPDIEPLESHVVVIRDFVLTSES